MSNSTIIILLLIFIFCFLFLPTATCSSNQTDLLSLLAFKSAMDLDPQGALNSWNETTHFYSWNGIQCGHRHRDRVVEINLMSQGLVGSVSPHVGNLSFLRNIILKNNSFYGQIPAQEMSLLRRLEIVEFSNNSFIGPIPKNLSQCPNLVYLNLIDNKLSGTIPTELGSLSKLEALGLSRNKLAGPVPPSIGNITSLTKLSLSACGLKGRIPESLVQLQSLALLHLSQNNLTGTVPYGLFNLSALQFFDVSFNKLRGVMPSTMGLVLPNLRGLCLGGNQFTGAIPVSISNASLLEIIAINSNYFTGPIPRVGRLTHLQMFLLWSNLLVDDISFSISPLTNCSKLRNLEVGNNKLRGSMPDSIANLSIHLKYLSLHTNKIHGSVPSGIGNLIGLNLVLLFDNHLEGSIPTSILKLSNLVEFDVGANRFTNELPSSLGNLTLLNGLYLNENNFLGNLPSSLGNCTDLLYLDLHQNNFNCLVPPEVLSLSSISILFDLSYNNFEGSIPYEVGSLTNLATLDLSNNRLSGLIPNSISRCMSLQELYLEGNLLEGEISLGLSALKGLQNVDLSRNNLTGRIPIFLGKLKLEHLNLSFNRLQGEVPVMGIFKNKTSFSLDGNKQLCGGILELKLPPCSPVKSQKTNLSTLLKILIPILAVGGICLILSSLIITYKRRMPGKNVTPVSQFNGIQYMRLSYADLIKATSGFSETNLLGVGRFGSVYKGILENGQTLVAIKVLNLFVRGASKSFMAECNALRSIRHRNLLKLLSVCESIDFQRNDFKALIYEFKANGSLEKWLYHSRDEEGEQNAEINNLNIIQRLNIAIDIAQAIEYLHFGNDTCIIHGDLKPRNILLDQDMAAYVGDFGLAKIVSKIVPSHESSGSTGIKGTLGYVPPEYGMSHSVSTEGDVYSYGIVLLEMFTNKRPTDDSFKDHINLHSFVDAALPDRVMEIVNPLLQIGPNVNNDKSKDCVTSIRSIGLSCSKLMPRDRTSMTNVVNELHKIRKFLYG